MIYRTSRNAEVYHTEPDCRALAGKDFQKLPDSHESRMNKPKCKYCSGVEIQNTGGYGGLSELERILQEQEA